MTLKLQRTLLFLCCCLIYRRVCSAFTMRTDTLRRRDAQNNPYVYFIRVIRYKYLMARAKNEQSRFRTASPSTILVKTEIQYSTVLFFSTDFSIFLTNETLRKHQPSQPLPKNTSLQKGCIVITKYFRLLISNSFPRLITLSQDSAQILVALFCNWFSTRSFVHQRYTVKVSTL